MNAGLVFQDAPYFVDGREHLKQNLQFQLRSATISQPCTVSDTVYPAPFLTTIQVPADTNYVESSIYHWTIQFKGYDYRPGGNAASDYIQLNNLWPFNVNYQLHNRLFDTNHSVPAEFQWQPDFANIPAPAVLGIGDPYWISQDLNNLADVAAEISGYTWSLQSGAQNLFGLAFGQALIHGYGIDPPTGLPAPWDPVDAILPPGQSLTLSNLFPVAFYSQTAQPVLQLAGYYFAPIFTTGTQLLGYGTSAADQPYPLPVNLQFASTNQTPVMVASVGRTIIIGGWQRFAVNGSGGKFAYLGQYFDKAYKVDTNGVTTTNQTGILSPYGEFLPIEPGRVMLTTKPDPDQGGIQGTALVHVLKIQLDVNHDGVMDTTFTGPDNTTRGRPYRFWINSDWDVRGYDMNGNGGPRASDYTDAIIGTARDLEDFARLWIQGLSALPSASGYSVTLSWRNTTGNPAVRLFRAYETNGGTLYLQDTNIVAAKATHSSDLLNPNGYGDAIDAIAVSSAFPFTFPANFFEVEATNSHFLFEGCRHRHRRTRSDNLTGRQYCGRILGLV